MIDWSLIQISEDGPHCQHPPSLGTRVRRRKIIHSSSSIQVPDLDSNQEQENSINLNFLCSSFISARNKIKLSGNELFIALMKNHFTILIELL